MKSGDRGEPDSEPRSDAQFLTTHWSDVFAAGEVNAPAAPQALERLCSTYRYPLYVFVRRYGKSPEDAEDLVQGFFASLIAKPDLADLSPSKGRFRAYLLARLKNFLSDARDREKAVKRGGGKPHVSLDGMTVEERYRQEPTDPMTPDKAYDVVWAQTLVKEARTLLRAEYEAAGKGELYVLLDCLEPGAAEHLTHAQIGERLNKTECAVKNEAARMRQRFRELLRAQVAPTVSTLPEIDEEIRYIIELLGG
ncbi:MAG: sigma-70 family RNA polymerase sigma factor [Verrucomicrobiae bacterium]|nr:sigma-70 family RNA polymerase sigma factor [Verrucomicrobiae bacterium]